MRAMQARSSRKQSISGLTLVEVLVSLLILTSGVAGVAATQTMGLKTVQSSYYRTQADLLLRDMADRIRANAGERNLYALSFGDQPAVLTGCQGGTCAGYDLGIWDKRVSELLPLGEASIQSLAPNGEATQVFDITIRWQDKVATAGANFCADDGSAELIYCMSLKVEI